MTASTSPLTELGLCVRTLVNHYAPVMPPGDVTIVRSAVAVWPLMEAVVGAARQVAEAPAGHERDSGGHERLAGALAALDAAVR